MSKELKHKDMQKQKKFNAADFFMIRVPLYSVDKYKDIFCTLEIRDEYEKNIFDLIENDPVVREAIMVSSLTLYKEFNNILRIKNGKKREQVLSSIVKYVTRLTTRTTPYGLFSGVTRGEFGEISNIKLSSKENNTKRARVDMEWLYAVIRRIENNENILDKINVFQNDLAWINGNRLEIPYISNYGQFQKEENYDNITASIRNTGQVQSVFELTKSPIMYKALFLSIVRENPAVDKNRIRSFLIQLLTNEYLITELRPPLANKDPFEYVLSKLKSIKEAENLYDSLIEIDSQIKRYNELPIGGGENLYLDIITKMKSIIECENYIQIDMNVAVEKATLKYSVAQEIEKIAELMLKLSQNKNTYDYMDNYLNDFLGFYGEDREIQILELLDDDIGLGAPANFTRPQSRRNVDYIPEDSETIRIQSFLQNKVLEVLIDNKDEVVITDEEIEEVQVNHQASEVPNSLEIYSLLSYSNEDNDFTIHLGANHGSSIAGKSFGRFIDIMPSAIKEDFKSIEKQQAELYGKDTIVAEITELPQSGRLSNVSLNWNPRKYEIALATNSNDSKDKIDIKDLYIGVEIRNYKRTFYIKSKSLDKRVIIRSNNMLNIYNNSNICRFLIEISQLNERNIVFSIQNNFERCFGKMNYTPRIRYSKTILYPASWKLNTRLLCLNDKNLTKETFYNAIDLWRTKWTVPSLLYLVESDNRLLLNLDNSLHLDELYYKLIKNMNTNLLLTEIEGNLDDRVVESNDGKYFSEIIVPLVKNLDSASVENEKKNTEMYETKSDYKVNRLKNSSSDVERTFFPGDEWLSIKLYGNSKRTEEFIGYYLQAFCKELLDIGIVTKFFFLRYADPEKHIRLRLKGNKNNIIYELIPKLNCWFEQLKADGLLSKVCIDTYIRETERYGGDKLIELAEDVFYKDSLIAYDLINYKRNKQLAIPLEVFMTASIINLMEGMNINYEVQKEIFVNYYEKTSNRKLFQEYRKELIILCNSDDDWNGLKSFEGGEALYNLFSIRRESIKAFGKKMMELDNENALWNNKISILFSIIHMHCNRILNSRENEHTVMATVRHTLHALGYHKKTDQ